MNRYIPNQHGAWAMLLLPFLCGLSLSGANWLHIPLFLCWLVMYLFSFPLLRWIKTRRTTHYRNPTVVYGVILLPLLTILVWLKPQLLWYSGVLLLLFIPNIYFARVRNERALLNDILAIILFCSFIYPVTYIGNETNWRLTSHTFIILVLYFCGTVLYVKTMIREKNNRTFYHLSISYHILITILASLYNLILLIPAAILLLRSIILPQLKLQTQTIGIIEILVALLVSLTLMLLH